MTTDEIQATVNRIQAKIVKLEAATNALHAELFATLRAFEAHTGLPPNTIRPADADPKPPK